MGKLEAHQFSIGLHGGGNFAKMDFTNNQEYTYTEIDNQQGFIGGIVLQFLGEKHAGVQAEFNYSQRGWIENDTSGIAYLKYKNKMKQFQNKMKSFKKMIFQRSRWPAY